MRAYVQAAVCFFVVGVGGLAAATWMLLADSVATFHIVAGYAGGTLAVGLALASGIWCWRHRALEPATPPGERWIAMPSRGIVLGITGLCVLGGVAQMTAGNRVSGTWILGCCALVLLAEARGVGRRDRARGRAGRERS